MVSSESPDSANAGVLKSDREIVGSIRAGAREETGSTVRVVFAAVRGVLYDADGIDVLLFG